MANSSPRFAPGQTLLLDADDNHSAFDAGQSNERQAQVAILRCIMGPLPLRPVSLDPTWRTPAVLHLAQAIYDDRAFDQLPILADALEEAGCTSRDVLDHCRSPGPHVRGCWAVDSVLGKGWTTHYRAGPSMPLP